MYKQIIHSEYLGGQIAAPFLIETKYEVGATDKEREGDNWIAYNKIPFKSYKHHKIDINKKLPSNKDKLKEEDVILSFLELKQSNTIFVPVSDYPMKYVGNHITDYYNEYLRNDTMNYAGESLNSLWEDPETRKKLYEDAYSLKRQNLFLRGDYNHKTAKDDIFSKLTDQDLKGTLQNSVFSNNQFKPFTAKVIYDYFDKKVGINTVLDFSSGWGGRMVGAISLDKNYIGIDPNTALKPSFKNILEKLSPYYSSKVNMIFNYGESIDYSKLDYDFVFTSPPYITNDGKQTEKYKNMKEYTIDSFYVDFLIPTIYRIMLNLPNGKYFCINTHIDNMNIIKKIMLGEENEKIPYKTKERAGGQKRRNIEGARDKYTEYIYCYKRTDGLIKQMEKKMKLNIKNKITNKIEKDLISSIEITGDGEKDSIKEIKKEIGQLSRLRRSRNNNSDIIK